MDSVLPRARYNIYMGIVPGLISLGKSFLKILWILLLATLMGQIPYHGESFENRYHRWVNSEGFQTGFWVAMKPVLWTSDKVQELWKDSPWAQKLSSR